MTPTATQREQFRKTLELALVAKMHRKFGDHWPDLFREALGPRQKTSWYANQRDGK